MAALSELAPRAPELYDLRRLAASDLDPLLNEETSVWRHALDWDFEKSADLVRRFVDLRALNGFALIEAGRVLGYSYYVYEDHKGLIGDLYISRGRQNPAYEDLLLEPVLDGLLSMPQVRRVESQLMMMGNSLDRKMPRERLLERYERDFMVLDLAKAATLVPVKIHRRFAIDRWSEHHQESAAHLIAQAYVGHIDSQINDQYQSLAGARRFLYNIVQYPGCGTFYKPGSLVAYDLDSGKLCGLSLTSVVGPSVGHITQICVSPNVRGTRLGYELLRMSLLSLLEQGCTKTSLTVTAANHEAIRLYRSVGFETVRKFAAFVWHGF